MSSSLTEWIHQNGDASLAYNYNNSGIQFEQETIQTYLSNGFITIELANILWEFCINKRSKLRVGQLIYIATSNHPNKKEIILEIIKQAENDYANLDIQLILSKYGFTRLHECREFENITLNAEWLDYIRNTDIGPIRESEINYDEIVYAYTNSEEYISNDPDFDLGSYQLLLKCFPDLAEQYRNNPRSIAFRYFYGSDSRKNQHGNYEDNIHTYGVDLDLGTGWKGIWAKTSGIYGGKPKKPSEDSILYLLIYSNMENLLNGSGFYDEGALDFHRLVTEGKTLRDLLICGGVIKISNN